MLAASETVFRSFSFLFQVDQKVADKRTEAIIYFICKGMFHYSEHLDRCRQMILTLELSYTVQPQGLSQKVVLSL